jgi:hypothetical protein
MKYFTPPLGPMQESGAALLRSMQNLAMVPLDLLVREAVQNSLDAALERDCAGGEVHVDFALRPHDTAPLAAMLGKHVSSAVLRRKFPDGARMLEIRDSRTEGLSGPVSMDGLGSGSSHGNLIKLVYEVGHTRSSEAAGGSWGLGKTCYFRVGIGLVIYYSRTLVDGRAEERLVACMVEDENGADRLQTDTATGIGWWGATGPRGGPAAVTDAAAIRRLLEPLQVRPFGHDETGTAVIIPFLRQDLVALPAVDDDAATPSGSLPAWWFESEASYIEVALQRWFCVRLDNPVFRTGPWLHGSVNGRKIARAEMLPVFQVTQSLYNRIVSRDRMPGDYLGRQRVPHDMVLCKPVRLNNVYDGPDPAGHVAAVQLTARQLGTGPAESGPDPYTCLFGQPEKSPPFRPIVTFMRSPGMSIRWDDGTSGRGWARGLKGPADGKYLVALFVPEPGRLLNASLRDRLRQPHATVESYLRSCERSDHHQWEDLSGYSIAERIRSNVSKHLRDHVIPPLQGPGDGIPIGLARRLANLLLPQRGLGPDGRNGRASPRTPGGPGTVPGTPGGGAGRPGTSTTGPGRGRGKGPRFAFRTGEPQYGRDRITLEWWLDWGAGSEPREITLSVDSERGPVSGQAWQESGLGSFPFLLADVEIAQLGPNLGARVPLKIEQHGSCLRLVFNTRSKQMPDALELHGRFSIVFPDTGAGGLCPLVEAAVVAGGKP